MVEGAAPLHALDYMEYSGKDVGVVLLNAWVVVFAAMAVLLLAFASPLAKLKKASTVLSALRTIRNSNNYDECTEQVVEVGATPPDHMVVACPPKHIAAIMDGNRRYGKKHHDDPLKGHTDGGNALVNVVEWCMQLGVQVLTVYAFSTENWSRPEAEVTCLMNVFDSYADNILEKALEKKIRVTLLASEPHLLPKRTYEKLLRLVELTKCVCCLLGVVFDCVCCAVSEPEFTLNLCVSYGARSEIAGAARNLAQSVLDGSIAVSDINEKSLGEQMLTAEFADPDLLIRTSEARLSNFLLWQLAYTEIQFIDKLWPEITQQDITSAVVAYSQRKRRFGK